MNRDNIIWTNDVYSALNDEYVQQEEYDTYVERCEDYDEEPLPFDRWLNEEFYTDYDFQEMQYEFFEQDFDQFIAPMIDRTLSEFPTSKKYGYKPPLFLIGSRSGWRAGSGGMVWETVDEFEDWLLHRDYDNCTDIYNDDGVMYLSSSDHDGSTGGTLYTFPSDESKILEMLKSISLYNVEDARDEYNESLTDDEILLEMFYDDVCNSQYISWRDFIKYPEYLEPIPVKQF